MTLHLAEILSQGDEVVTGDITDTNAAWLSRELTRLGFTIARHTTVGDHLASLSAVIADIATRADLCLCTGGLGPTCDDLTAEAVARAFDLPLELDPIALTQIESFFTRQHRIMPEVNKKQALLPRGAERLDNLWGTAPGFALQAGRCRLVFMPGVPSEMKAMFGQWVAPDLPRRYALNPARLVILHTVGMGESALQECLDRIALSPEIKLGFRAGGPENQVKLLFPADFPAIDRDATVQRAAAAIGGAVYAIADHGDENASLEAALAQLLAERHATLYAVETVSGGLLARRCGECVGWLGAWVVPDVDLVPGWLGADKDPADIAVKTRILSGADYALVQYASPSTLGATTLAVEFVLAGPGSLWRETRQLGGDATRRRTNAAALALDFVRRCLLTGAPGPVGRA